MQLTESSGKEESDQEAAAAAADLDSYLHLDYNPALVRGDGLDLHFGASEFEKDRPTPFNIETGYKVKDDADGIEPYQDADGPVYDGNPGGPQPSTLIPNP